MPCDFMFSPVLRRDILKLWEHSEQKGSLKSWQLLSNAIIRHYWQIVMHYAADFRISSTTILQNPQPCTTRGTTKSISILRPEQWQTNFIDLVNVASDVRSDEFNQNDRSQKWSLEKKDNLHLLPCHVVLVLAVS